MGRVVTQAIIERMNSSARPTACGYGPDCDQSVALHNVVDVIEVYRWVAVRSGQYDTVFCRNLLMYLTADAGQTLIYSIIGAMEANKGIYYRYPYTIRFIP